jgi:glyoxylase-like metal-dependent hydrolase (beta-lactamase superfamily II)
LSGIILRLISRACGRVDFPDSDVEEMVASLLRIKKLDGNVMVFPGHSYGGEWSSVHRERVEGVLHPSQIAHIKAMK